ncbi:hypothetical protein Y032_0028g1803 [Ancylostoma ceylanicum]|nr:hypothetical protein Y032_0028g1803 [Ancylostoma ceylanicum]
MWWDICAVCLKTTCTAGCEYVCDFVCNYGSGDVVAAHPTAFSHCSNQLMDLLTQGHSRNCGQIRRSTL